MYGTIGVLVNMAHSFSNLPFSCNCGTGEVRRGRRGSRLAFEEQGHGLATAPSTNHLTSMRRIVMFNWLTADGYFAAADGSLDWVVPDRAQVHAAVDAIPHFDTLLFGRK